MVRQKFSLKGITISPHPGNKISKPKLKNYVKNLEGYFKDVGPKQWNSEKMMFETKESLLAAERTLRSVLSNAWNIGIGYQILKKANTMLKYQDKDPIELECTDTTIVCKDGSIRVHAFVLALAHSGLKEILLNEDQGELVFPFINFKDMLPALEEVYCKLSANKLSKMFFTGDSHEMRHKKKLIGECKKRQVAVKLGRLPKIITLRSRVKIVGQRIKSPPSKSVTNKFNQQEIAEPPIVDNSLSDHMGYIKLGLENNIPVIDLEEEKSSSQLVNSAILELPISGDKLDNNPIMNYEKESEKICQHCETVFSDSESLTNHISSKHGTVIWYCNLCKENFWSKKDVYEHRANFCPLPVFTPNCPFEDTDNESDICQTICRIEDCGHKSTGQRELVTHILKQHNLRPHECPMSKICKIMSTSLKILARHIVTSHHTSNWYCPRCPEVAYKDQRQLNGHWETDHLQINPKCSQCSLVFNRRSSIRKHYYKKHKTPIWHTWEFSDVCYDENPKYKLVPIVTNAQIQSVKKIKPDEQRRLACAICLDVSFESRTILELHMKQCHNYTFLTCTICNENTFTMRKDLIKHRDHFHSAISPIFGIKKSACTVECPADECRKKFEGFTNLTTHLFNAHSNLVNEENVCSLCPTLPDYVTRMETFVHLSENHGKICNHLCSECKEKFDTKDELWEHIDSIHFKKRYQCYRCCDSFDKINLFNDHMINIHNDSYFKVQTSSLECFVCNRPMSNKRSKITHYDLYHAPRRCCGIFYPEAFDRNDFLNHLKDHHPTEYGKFCSQCGSLIKKSRYLYHMRRFHPDFTNLNCYICNKPFNNFASIHKHIRSTHKKYVGFAVIREKLGLPPLKID